MFSKLTSVRPVTERPVDLLKGTMEGRDWFSDQIELKKKEREATELDKTYKERQQMLESLQQNIEKLQKKCTDKEHFVSCCFEIFLKNEDSDEALKIAEGELEKELTKEPQIDGLKEECARLAERKQELQLQVQRHTIYKDFIERVLRISKFEDVDDLTGYFQSLLQLRDQLFQKENQVQEQVYQQRKALLEREDDHILFCLQKNNELFQLQTELENAHSQTLIWEKKWNHILETAAETSLKLTQTQVATLNLYELAGSVAEVEVVDFYDTHKQLEQIKTFIWDQKDILKLCHTFLKKQVDEKKEENVSVSNTRKIFGYFEDKF